MHPDYFGNQQDRRDKLEKVTALLSDLTNDIFQLDVYKLLTFAEFYKSPTGAKVTKSSGFGDLYQEIQLACETIKACQVAYSSTFPKRQIRRGRRPLPYVEATRELISLWQKYAGTKVPISKTHQHEIITNEGRFIKLGLMMINPNISDANVITSINNARSG